MLKRSTTKEEQFKEILIQLDNELRFRLVKSTSEKKIIIIVIILDNESIIKQRHSNYY